MAARASMSPAMPYYCTRVLPSYTYSIQFDQRDKTLLLNRRCSAARRLQSVGTVPLRVKAPRSTKNI